MVDQLRAITGGMRRRRSNVIDIINAQAAFLPTERRLAQDVEREEKALAEAERANRASLALRRQALAAQEEQAEKAQLISGISTGVQGAFLLDKVTGGRVATGLKAAAMKIPGVEAATGAVKTGLSKAAGVVGLGKAATLSGKGTSLAKIVADAGPSIGTGTVTIGGEAVTGAAATEAVVPVAKGAEAVAAASTATEGAAVTEAGALAEESGLLAGAELSTAIPAILAVTGIELTKDQFADYTEAQIGTSAKPVAGIAARAGQGALIGTFILPGLGTTAGTAIGAAVGAIEEAADWISETINDAGDWFTDQGIFDWGLFGGSDPEPSGIESAAWFSDQSISDQIKEMIDAG